MAVPRVASPSSPWPAHARVALATPRTFAPALGFALAVACASLATQTYWLETGDDFLLGLVPAFYPAGVGNLPVFAVTAALALCGAWATVLAAALRTHGLRG